MNLHNKDKIFHKRSWHVVGMKIRANKQYFGSHILIDISNT